MGTARVTISSVKLAQIILPIIFLGAAACGPLDEAELAVDFDEVTGKSYSDVKLRTYNGHYVVAEDGGGTKVNANRVNPGAWETFRMFDLGNGNVALRAANGQYMVAEYGGGGRVNANRDGVAEWETFARLNKGDGRVAFRTHNGHYLVAEYGGGSTFLANRVAIGDWELFTLVQ